MVEGRSRAHWTQSLDDRAIGRVARSVPGFRLSHQEPGPEKYSGTQFGWLQGSRKALKGNKFWLQGVDLNHRPLGYEGNGGRLAILRTEQRSPIKSARLRSVLGCFWPVSDGLSRRQKADTRANASGSSQARQWKMRVLGETGGGEGGIRALGTAVNPYNGLAKHRASFL
jgi:hypothetical protein